MYVNSSHHAAIVGAGLSVLLVYCITRAMKTSRRTASQNCNLDDGVLGLIGNTPIVLLKSLSDQTGCQILAKAEFMNPGGSIKDRIALHIVRKAIESGKLLPGGTIVEATAGSTGVSLAMVAAATGHKCQIFIPDDVAIEKQRELEARGAKVTKVRPVSISHPDHMIHLAEKAAATMPGALFVNQFENGHNTDAHLATGEEIWTQTKGSVDAFVCGSGTGGTIAGVSQSLKKRKRSLRIFLVDPPGSSLYLKVKRGVLYNPVEAEGRRVRNPFDTVTEGVGLNRLTSNFAQAQIDDAVKCSDQEAVDMAFFLLHTQGLWVGSSSAVNCVGAVKVARQLGPGHTIVTVLCDGGQRHLSKFFNTEFLEENNLQVPDVLDRNLSWIR